MRSKLLVTTICVAGSVWAGGCAQRPLRSCGDSRLTRELTCCNATTCPEIVTARPGARPSAARPQPLKSPAGETLIIVPEQPNKSPSATPRSLPWIEKSPSVPQNAPRNPTPIQKAPASTGPQDLPPPPTFPDLLPAPTPKAALRPLKYKRPIVVREGQGATLPARMAGGDPFAGFESNANSSDAGENHRTLTGEVQQFRRGWRLRYAAVDVVDAHGGSVSLTGAGLEQLKDGARIRVTGTLIPADDRLSSARFQVQTVEMLEP